MSHSSPRAQLGLLALIAALGALRTADRAAPAPTRWVDDSHGVCVASDGRAWVVRLCAEPEQAAWFAPDPIRPTLGLPPCWYTAAAPAFAGIAGIGDATAARIAAYRDAGGPPDVQRLAAADNVSTRQARAAVRFTTTRCGRVSAEPAGPDSAAPIGSSTP